MSDVMDNDAAQDFLASLCPPEQAGTLGAAIRGIRAKAIADAKAWFGTADDMDPERLARALHATGLNTIGRKPGSHGPYTDRCICNSDAAQITAAYAAQDAGEAPDGR